MSYIFHEPFEPAIHGPRRTFSPVLARRGFSRAGSFSALDLWSEDAQPTQRRAYASLRVIAAVVVPFSPVRRLAASLMASDGFDEFYPAQRVTRFAFGYAPITGDFGLSASFTLTFSGTGDDPTAPERLVADPTDALQGLGAKELAVVPGVTFSGQSASKIV